MGYEYSNADIRSILSGLGFLGKDCASRGGSSGDVDDFPVIYNNSSLDPFCIKDAIQQFQQYFHINPADGNWTAQTNNTATEEMETLHKELNSVLGTNLNPNVPLYNLDTADAIREFQSKIGEQQNGIASLHIRQRLNQAAQGGN